MFELSAIDSPISMSGRISTTALKWFAKPIDKRKRATDNLFDFSIKDSGIYRNVAFRQYYIHYIFLKTNIKQELYTLTIHI